MVLARPQQRSAGPFIILLRTSLSMGRIVSIMSIAHILSFVRRFSSCHRPGAALPKLL